MIKAIVEEIKALKDENAQLLSDLLKEKEVADLDAMILFLTASATWPPLLVFVVILILILEVLR